MGEGNSFSLFTFRGGGTRSSLGRGGGGPRSQIFLGGGPRSQISGGGSQVSDFRRGGGVPGVRFFGGWGTWSQ